MDKKRIRVLWTTNIVLPTVAEELGLPVTSFGGWLTQMLYGLAAQPHLVIGVAMRSPGRQYRRIEQGNIVFYSMPQASHDAFDVLQSDCDRVLEDFEPDLLHAQGSEMAFTERFMRSWEGPRVLSLQGVLNGIAPFQLGNLSMASLFNPLHPRSMMFACALLLNERLRFRPRLRTERSTIALAHHLVGRTSWDRAHSTLINPQAQYIHCGELLRRDFYEHTWSQERCQPYSIFIGSGASPLKGLHIALSAIAKLRIRYPRLSVSIAGPSPAKVRKYSLKGQFGYLAYVQSLVKHMRLESLVSFTGELTPPEMARRMCSSNVYLLPSLIENSPNTLCEAMLMGVPCVASFVGGVPSIAQDGVEALLYRAEDPVMMAFQIQRLFDDTDLCRRLSTASRARSMQLHDAASNIQTMDSLYRNIANQNNDIA